MQEFEINTNTNKNTTKIVGGKVYDFNKPFTQEEKDAILAKHKKFVDLANTTLTDDLKLKYDENLKQKLEDPAQARIYRKLEYINARAAEEEKILESLIDKYPINANDRTLTRTLRHSLKVDGSEESKKFNEDYYKAYVANPDKFFYNNMKKLINTNVGEIDNLGDDMETNLDYYIKNKEIIEDAFSFDSTLNNDRGPKVCTTDFKKLSKTKAIVEDMSNAKSLVQMGGKDEFLVIPKLNNEQAIMVMNNVAFTRNAEANGFNQATIARVCTLSLMEARPQVLKTLKNKNIVLDNKVIKNLKVTDNEKQKEANLRDALEDDNQNKYTYGTRDADELYHINNITKKFEGTLASEHGKVFLTEYNKKPNVAELNNFKIDTVKNITKGSIWERIGRTTSPQFKAFRQALEDYNNPESDKCLDTKNLKEAAQAYMDYKTGQKNPKNFNSTEKVRMALCESIVSGTNYIDKNRDKLAKAAEVKYLGDDAKLFKSYEKEPAFDEKSLSDLDDSIKVDNKEVDLDKSFDSSKDLDDMSMDEQNKSF